MLVYDDIIRKLQPFGGGIRYYWDVISDQANYSISTHRFESPKFCRYLPVIKNFSSEPYAFHSSYYRINHASNAVNVTTVHDFVYDFFSSGIKKLGHVNQKKYALHYSSKIICISQNTKKDLEKLFPQEIKGKSVEVLYNGFNTFEQVKDFSASASETEAELISWATQKPFLLFVGSRAFYKNFEFAVEICAELKEYSMCIVGGGHLSEAHHKLLTTKLRDNFRFLPYVSEGMLKYLYQNTAMLLYPSSYEGFGMPPLEVLFQGGKVFALNNNVNEEILGDFIELYSGNTLEQAVSYVKNHLRGNIILDRQSLLTRYCWKKNISALQEIYDTCLN